jgi:cobalt-precorrin 5A hydrolase
MIVAGFGFRAGAPLASLKEALTKARGAHAVDALATLTHKATALKPLADHLDLPLVHISPERAALQKTTTQSQAVAARFGTGSVAEATALAALAPNATLLGPRVLSDDRQVSCALATGDPLT